MTTKIGPKEAEIRKLREARNEKAKRAAQNQKLLKDKMKVKMIGSQVVRIKAVKRER